MEKINIDYKIKDKLEKSRLNFSKWANRDAFLLGQSWKCLLLQN